MSTEVKIVTEAGDVLETIKVKHACPQFLIYRGRLFERVLSDAKKPHYTERSYLELY